MPDSWGERIYTKHFNESVGGILLCGINPGGGGTSTRRLGDLSDAPSYFSDVRCVNASFPYQQTIRAWFQQWGYPLNEKGAGPFERCISQTNWNREPTRYAEGTNYDRESLVACAPTDFFPVLATVKPRLLLLFGVEHLPGALADLRLRPALEELVGPMTEQPREEWRERSSGKVRFRWVAMAFQRCRVLALPHPTPRSGALATTDIQQIGPEFDSALRKSGLSSLFDASRLLP